jgi:hypothetical protein
MIINHKAKWIFVLPPKTGSTSLSALLQSPVFGGVRFVTGDPRVLDQHWPWPPSGTEAYKLYLSVRHPVARVVSQFRQYRRVKGIRHPAARSLTAWVDRLAQPKLLPHPHWGFTCWMWLPDVLRRRLAGVVRCERMREDLERLGIARAPFEVPHLHPGQGPIPVPSEDVRARILEWGREDLIRFGYSRGRDRAGCGELETTGARPRIAASD